MRLARRAYAFLCWAFVVLLPVQFLLGGMGIMGGDLEVHMGFGIMVLGTLIPLMLLVTGLVGRMWALAGLGLLLGVVLHLLPIFPSAENAWVAALHPVIALLSWPFVYFVLLRGARERLAETRQVIVAEPAPAAGPA